MSVILMTTLFYKALISQGEIWCWSLLWLKGLSSRRAGIIVPRFLESLISANRLSSVMSNVSLLALLISPRDYFNVCFFFRFLAKDLFISSTSCLIRTNQLGITGLGTPPAKMTTSSQIGKSLTLPLLLRQQVGPFFWNGIIWKSTSNEKSLISSHLQLTRKRFVQWRLHGKLLRQTGMSNLLNRFHHLLYTLQRIPPRCLHTHCFEKNKMTN